MKMKILLRGALISSLMVIFSLSSLNSYQIFKNLDPKRMELFTFGPWAEYMLRDSWCSVQSWPLDWDIRSWGVGSILRLMSRVTPCRQRNKNLRGTLIRVPLIFPWFCHVNILMYLYHIRSRFIFFLVLVVVIKITNLEQFTGNLVNLIIHITWVVTHSLIYELKIVTSKSLFQFKNKMHVKRCKKY